MSQSEEEQVWLAKSDPRNFKPLYDKYYKRIFLFVVHRVGEKVEAQDLVSAVFLKALTGLDKYTFKGLPFSSWLYRIAINECNQYFRSNSTKRHVLLDDINYFCLADEINVFEEERRPALERAIQRLKSSELLLIELRFFESFSFREIGDMLNITENNAKVRLYRTLEKLRKLLKIK